MKIVEFNGWQNCVEIQNGDFTLIVTTDVGPRIIGGFCKGSENIFYVDPETAGETGGDEWNIYGGHRLWHSPEAKPRTYEVENSKVEFKKLQSGFYFSAGTNSMTGIHKSITIKNAGKNAFRVDQTIRNNNLWDIELAGWALSVMAPGGVAIVPQPQGDKHALLPNKYVTVWPYTSMSDPRFTWGDKHILLRQDANAKGPCKFGINCEDGWLAYLNKGFAFVKTFEYLVDAEYPDNGCSVEVYTNKNMLEVETLSPLYLLAPGEEIMHTEYFRIFEYSESVETEKDAVKFQQKLIKSICS